MAERFRPRLICIACNTASTIALGMVREVLEVPIVGTVPAIKPAAAMTRTGTIGLLGTAATIRQAYVDQLEAEFAAGKRLLRHAAPELVAAAEAKLRGEPVDPAVVRRAPPRACATSRAARRSTRWCSPAPISRCSRTNSARRSAPRCASSTARRHRPADRVADPRPAIRPRRGPISRCSPATTLTSHRLTPTLARYGLSAIEVL